MTKAGLNEIFKLIDIRINNIKHEIEEAKAFDKQYHIGKKHALVDLKHDLEVMHRNILEAVE